MPPRPSPNYTELSGPAANSASTSTLPQTVRWAVQRTADATVWPTISGGCHLARDTATALEDGGFLIERVERFEFSVSALDPKKTHILGTARRV